MTAQSAAQSLMDTAATGLKEMPPDGQKFLAVLALGFSSAIAMPIVMGSPDAVLDAKFAKEAHHAQIKAQRAALRELRETGFPAESRYNGAFTPK